MTNIPPDFDLQSYDFDLPENLIAQDPVAERSQSRLLVLNRTTGATHEAKFADIVSFLPAGALLVVNNTKVLPARLMGHKLSGGRVEFLLLTPLSLLTPTLGPDGRFWAKAQGLLKASKGPRTGERLFFADLELVVLEKNDFGRAQVRLTWEGDLSAHFLNQGHMPLPPYIRRQNRPEDHTRYQTIYARSDKLGSVAAPTAGLHFTPEILEGLSTRDIHLAEVSLYVGYGTFSPVRVNDIRQHTMHAEYAEISPETARLLALAKAEKRPIVAVGTTTTRALESMVTKLGTIGPFQDWTDIFICPGYEFKIVDQLITNFHLPHSSLLIMVSALAGRRHILDAYAQAVHQGFRFFSYGDAMLIR